MSDKFELMEYWQDTNNRRFVISFQIPRLTQGMWEEIQFLVQPIEDDKESMFFSFRVTDTAIITRKEVKNKLREFLLDVGYRHLLLWVEQAEYGQSEHLILKHNSSNEAFNPSITHLLRNEFNRIQKDILIHLEEVFFQDTKYINEEGLAELVFCSKGMLSKALSILRDKGLVKQINANGWVLTHQGMESTNMLTDEKYSDEKRNNQINASKGVSMKWDVFICHASEDKDEIADELARTLQGKGLNVWYDDFELEWGDSLRKRIDDGLSSSHYGVVILSEAFFAKKWPQDELDGLFSLEFRGVKRILPVWHKITRDRVAEYSPIMAGRLARSSEEGIQSLVDELLRLIKKRIRESNTTSNEEMDLAEQNTHPVAGIDIQLSNSAAKIAQLFNTKSAEAFHHDPSFNLDGVSEKLSISREEVEEGFDELEEIGLINVQKTMSNQNAWPTNELFVSTDPIFQGHNPVEDAREIAKYIVELNTKGRTIALEEIDKHFEWGPRRINPAITYLVEHGIVDSSETLNPGPYKYLWMMVTAKTRRYAREVS